MLLANSPSPRAGLRFFYVGSRLEDATVSMTTERVHGGIRGFGIEFASSPGKNA